MPHPTRRSILGLLAAAPLLSTLGQGRASAADAPRVAGARQRAQERVRGRFRAAGVGWPPSSLFLRAFKHEGELELWALAASGGRYTRVHTFPVCASSGVLGPKRRQGDGQVPEGFYRVSQFNPASQFHLSVRVDYPNASDRVLGAGGPLGGDIFIHGKCVTIGCLPLTDEGIDELYLALWDVAPSGGVPIHLFPARMDAEGWVMLQGHGLGQPALLAFWSNLKEGFDWFEARGAPPRVRVDRAGRYLFSA